MKDTIIYIAIYYKYKSKSRMEAENIVKYILKIFIVVLILLATILFLNKFNKSSDVSEQKYQLKEVVTIEKMSNSNSNSISSISPLEMDNSKSFCKNYQHKSSASSLEASCNGLTDSNCKSVDCCVLLNGKKCVAGNENGPTFRTETNGEKRNIDFYYYKNKYYGY